jgi:hypothetical protein
MMANIGFDVEARQQEGQLATSPHYPLYHKFPGFLLEIP